MLARPGFRTSIAHSVEDLDRHGHARPALEICPASTGHRLTRRARVCREFSGVARRFGGFSGDVAHAVGGSSA